MTTKSHKSKANATSFKEGDHGNSKGAPRKEIDFASVQRLVDMGFTQKELCRALDVDDKTLTARIKDAGYASNSDFFATIKKENLEISLSRKRARLDDLQFECAEEKNVSMLIWLGKQYLGQREPDRKDETTVIINPEIIAERNARLEKNKRLLKHAARIKREEEDAA